MPFSTEREAKQFLADKIYQESEIQNAPLSEIDRRLLRFSEQDPGSEKGIPEDVLYGVDYAWETRMTALLKQAWQRDKENPLERQNYLDAMDRLKGSGHYIQVIAGPVFDRFGFSSASAFPQISVQKILLWAALGVVVFFAIALLMIAVSR